MKLRHLLPLLVMMLLSLDASARNTKQMLPIEAAMNHADAKEKLNQGIKYYFGKQEHGKIVKNFGNFQSNKKANAFGRSDEEACNRAFLSAMLSFQERALQEGGNAVVNIRSYYYKNEVVSETEFECGAGAIMAGVTFKGDVVKIE